MLRAIAGAHRPATGRILFEDADVTAVPAYARLRMGIALVPEGRRLFAGMTVKENLMVAGRHGRPGPWNLETVVGAFPMLAARIDSRAANLSGGEQQATAIGRALMTNPKLLLLDEVSLGLAPIAVEAVYRSLSTLIAGGTTIVLVEQDIGRALGVATRVACMLEGRIILQGRAKDMTPRAGHAGLFRFTAAKGGNVVTWVTQLLNGVLLGGYYALLACGLSFMFGVMRIINLAHGDLAVLSAFLVFLIADTTDISPFIALIAVLPVMALVGWGLQRWMLERSLRAGVLVPLLTTFGLAIVIENGLFEYFGADYAVARALYRRLRV